MGKFEQSRPEHTVHEVQHPMSGATADSRLHKGNLSPYRNSFPNVSDLNGAQGQDNSGSITPAQP